MQNQTKTVPLADRNAADVMQRALVTVGADDLLADVERVMTDAHVSGAPVVDGAGRVLGILSLRDLVRHRADDDELPADADPSVFDDRRGARARGARAADVMTQELVTVPPLLPLPQVAQRMFEARVHRVLVEDQDELVGLVSSTDLIGAIAGMV